MSPLYLRAQSGQLPELKRVIAAYGDRVVMEETLPATLAALFKVSAPVAGLPAVAGSSPAGPAGERAREALAHYDRAIDRLKVGDWAGFGVELDALRPLLEELTRQPGALAGCRSTSGPARRRMRDAIMPLNSALVRSMIAATAERIIDSADELTSLDQAIGDGDHGINMKRGWAEVLSQLDEIAGKSTGEALKAVGMALVMKVGGASGPLYGSLFMAMGKALGDRPATLALLPEVFAAGVDAVAARGKSAKGEKTMLDVLVPALETVRAGGPDIAARLRETAARAPSARSRCGPLRGAPAFLGERSIGHMDPGARSSQIIVEALSGRISPIAFVRRLSGPAARPGAAARPRNLSFSTVIGKILLNEGDQSLDRGLRVLALRAEIEHRVQAEAEASRF